MTKNAQIITELIALQQDVEHIWQSISRLRKALEDPSNPVKDLSRLSYTKQVIHTLYDANAFLDRRDILQRLQADGERADKISTALYQITARRVIRSHKPWEGLINTYYGFQDWYDAQGNPLPQYITYQHYANGL